jgi:N-methylhydantoinase B/oxoprolinase/acetone carboxylase alpha subunit
MLRIIRTHGVKIIMDNMIITLVIRNKASGILVIKHVGRIRLSKLAKQFGNEYVEKIIKTIMTGNEEELRRQVRELMNLIMLNEP